MAGRRGPWPATALDGMSEGEADELGAARGGVPVARDRSVLRSGPWTGGRVGDRESVKEGEALAMPPAEVRECDSAP
ncbi:hypothetical protein SCANM124S_05002 [Streptomyces canus]